MPLGKDVKIETLVHSTEGLVGADLEGLCRQAALFAIREIVEPAGAGSRARRQAPGANRRRNVQKLKVTKRHSKGARRARSNRSRS